MNAIFTLVIVGAIAISGGCWSRGEVQPTPRAGATAADKAAPVRFDALKPPELRVKRLRSGHILVRPVVNGHDAGWYIFDTGAGICCASTPELPGLELQPAGDIDSTGVGGSQTSKLFAARSLALGPATFADVPMMGVDLAFLQPLIGEKISGIIGYGVLSRCVAEIGLAGPRVALFDSAKYSLPRGEWTSLDISKRVPVVAGAFEGHPARFRLDLGANGSITLHKPSVDKYDLLSGRELTDCKLGGVGGFVKGKRGRLATLELGQGVFENVPAEFALEAKGSFADPAIDANIGTDILVRFEIVTDYAGQRIALLRKPEPEIKK